ncbi:glycosyltransferase [Sphingobium sp. RSMS]|uniref:glycosyltransferase n=1 Tax=Sphingobium sp. RSMS TaxID=520734 RepID=UPI0010F9C8B9|nr:glycosyltransferase [Sphingobium sp. RSMS]UXC89790.1 glycosyltransferase [Sphingobium sp. RSMS]
MIGIFSIGRARRASRRAKRTLSPTDWQIAADAWHRVADSLPRSARVWVQYGHALRRANRSAEACGAYHKAIALDRDLVGAWVGLGIAWKAQGARSSAMDAFTQALRLDPNALTARNELLLYGGRSEQPEPTHGRLAMADALAGLAVSLRETRDWQRDFNQASLFPLQDYAHFRRLNWVPAPEAAASIDFTVLIDADAATPVQLRATIQSLLRQTHGEWRARIEAPQALREHPVGSLCHVDPRVRFTDADREEPEEPTDWLLLVEAGTILAPDALGWFAWTANETACVAAYCDHDHVTLDWKYGPIHHDPVLQPVYDRHWFADAGVRPAALLVRRSDVDGKADLVQMLARMSSCPVAHIPQILASRLADASPPRPTATPVKDAGGTGGEARIAVIIPTRDNAPLLSVCVRSLIDKAARPDLLDIIIVSNRSAKAETHALLAELKRDASTTVLDFDEPFNWSRANNVAVQESRAELLLFLNDDTEMLSDQWDALVRSDLVGPHPAGMVGALLFYPHGGIQHAGVVMGVNEGGPEHEARWQSNDECGPLARWKRVRACSAVTGAFMAMPRTLFDRLGGFDEANFIIAYNDIDMCLRVRESGEIVLYDPRITLIHHESISRGANLTRDMVAWDCGELEALHRRWGQALFQDPGYNLHYTRQGYPFDGYRHPAAAEVEAHIRRSASDHPWAVSRVE